MGVLHRILRYLRWGFISMVIGYGVYHYLAEVHTKEIHMHAHLAEEKLRRRNQLATERYRNEIQVLTRENGRLKKQLASIRKRSPEQFAAR